MSKCVGPQAYGLNRGREREREIKYTIGVNRKFWKRLKREKKREMRQNEEKIVRLFLVWLRGNVHTECLREPDVHIWPSLM